MKQIDMTAVRERAGRAARVWRRRAQPLVVVAAVLYGLLIAFPEPVFPCHRTRGAITLYAAAPLPPAATDAVLDRAARLLSACPINDPARHHRVFLCYGFARFALFTPLRSQAVSTNSFLNDTIFVVDADIARDRVRRDPVRQSACGPADGDGSGNVARTLSGTIALEATHSLSRHRRGVLRSLISPNPSWKEEGYCDWVAHDSSFDPVVGRRRLAAARAGNSAGEDSPCFRYFTYREAVTRLIERQGFDYDTLMATPLDPPGSPATTPLSGHPGP
jgi:hypothetical protein